MILENLATEKFHLILDSELINMLKSVGVESLLDFKDIHECINWLAKAYATESHNISLPHLTSQEEKKTYFRNITSKLVEKAALLLIFEHKKWADVMLSHYAWTVKLFSVDRADELSKKLFALAKKNT
jgi:hypothetical protein